MADDDAQIYLAPHDLEWTRLFAEEREQLQHVLSPWLRGPIEHVGSTAVPGLVAKPVIDIMAAVGTLEESRDAIVALQSLNYLDAPYREDVEHWFCKPRPSFRTHHLHLVPHGSPTWMAVIAFRDRLREAPAVANAYADLKVQLAASFRHDREAYTAGKGAFVARVLGEAPGSSEVR